MGLYVSHITTLPSDQVRELYVYLLDYGWPEEEYEKIFRKSFESLAKRASETGAIVIASHRGVHFANEVLSYHRVFDLDASEVLPAVLITKTHPSYFVETFGPEEHPVANPELDDLCEDDVVLIPLKLACTSPEEFTSLAESIFADLTAGLALQNFRVSKYDTRVQRSTEEKSWRRTIRRLGKVIILEPNIGGLGVNLKELIGIKAD